MHSLGGKKNSKGNSHVADLHVFYLFVKIFTEQEFKYSIHHYTERRWVTEHERQFLFLFASIAKRKFLSHNKNIVSITKRNFLSHNKIFCFYSEKEFLEPQQKYFVSIVKRRFFSHKKNILFLCEEGLLTVNNYFEGCLSFSTEFNNILLTKHKTLNIIKGINDRVTRKELLCVKVNILPWIAVVFF